MNIYVRQRNFLWTIMQVEQRIIEYLRGTFVLEKRAEKELEEFVCGREIFGLSLKIHSRKKNCKMCVHQTN